MIEENQPCFFCCCYLTELKVKGKTRKQKFFTDHLSGHKYIAKILHLNGGRMNNLKCTFFITPLRDAEYLKLWFVPPPP